MKEGSYIVLHNNVDNDPSIWFEITNPTIDDLIDFFSAYYDLDKCKEYAEELFDNEEVCLYDVSSTYFYLKKLKS